MLPSNDENNSYKFCSRRSDSDTDGTISVIALTRGTICEADVTCDIMDP